MKEIETQKEMKKLQFRFHSGINEFSLALPLSLNYYFPDRGEWKDYNILNIVILTFRFCFIWRKKLKKD